MLSDSIIWQNELKKELSTFTKTILPKSFSDEDSIPDSYIIGLEKFFFYSAFIIRKLNESNKLSDELVSERFEIYRYRQIYDKPEIDWLNKHKIDFFYDTGKPEKIKLSLINLCNLLIHSFVFQSIFSEEEDDKRSLSTIYVNSDYTKKNYMYEIYAYNYCDLIKHVIEDHVARIKFDRRTGQTKRSSKIR